MKRNDLSGIVIVDRDIYDHETASHEAEREREMEDRKDVLLEAILDYLHGADNENRNQT